MLVNQPRLYTWNFAHIDPRKGTLSIHHEIAKKLRRSRDPRLSHIKNYPRNTVEDDMK